MKDSMGLSCGEFVEVLASKEPAPGGGGAAAYVAAIGTALGNMVGSLTVGKEKYADVEDDMSRAKARADELQSELLELVAADAVAFEPLSRAYGLPKGTEEERARKAEVMEKCLRDSCAVPLQIMHKVAEAIELVEEFAAKGSALAISDAGCAATICKAALEAASLNVYVNTKSMADRAYAEARDAEADALLAEYCPRADAVFDQVEARLRK